MITLNAKDVLIAARKAFDAGELQVQDLEARDMGCFYAGPCAIGAAIPKELREEMDNAAYRYDIFDTSIESLVEAKLVETDNLETLEELQFAHDEGDVKTFEQNLIRLEKKHGL